MDHQSQTSLDFGAVLLFAFPHTDGMAGMERPCVVVSCKTHNDAAMDVVIAPITTKMWQLRTPNSVRLNDWKEAGLKHESLVKPVLATVQRTDLGKRIGDLSQRDKAAVKLSLATVLGFRLAPRP